MQIGKNITLPKIFVTWPHQVKLGNNCILERFIYFKYDGMWEKGPSIRIGNDVFIGNNCEFNISQGISVGNNSMIASGCKFIDHDHGTEKGKTMGGQPQHKKDIVIGEDVWLGCNVIVLKGVVIEDGAVIAAGSVVTKRVSSNEIWGGVPAKYLRHR